MKRASCGSIQWLISGSLLMVAAYATYAGITWIRYGQGRHKTTDSNCDSQLENLIPVFDVVERLQQFTLGLYKNFPIRENKESIQFRAEFFNAFNHVNLGGIDGTLEDPTFGDISSTANDSREIQFALKVYF